MLAELILKVIINVKYKFDGLADESELFMLDMNRRVLLRKGLPQGLSLSPLLCTLAVEQFMPPKGTFMYADDGAFIGPEEQFRGFKLFMKEAELAGAIMEESKSG